MRPNLEQVKLLSRDLRDGREYARSPRETLGGYVLAARALDKCRAVLTGQEGEYHSNCPLDQRWLKFAEIDYAAFKSFVLRAQPTRRSPRGLGSMPENAPALKLSLGITENATCV
jgi:Domain of unknown function (DUF5069)